MDFRSSLILALAVILIVPMLAFGIGIYNAFIGPVAVAVGLVVAGFGYVQNRKLNA